jgi:hypothetical protein
MPSFNKTFKIESNLIINIKRCLRKKVFNHYKFIPLSNSAYFYYARQRSEPFLLPKLYVALTFSRDQVLMNLMTIKVHIALHFDWKFKKIITQAIIF